MLYFLKGIKNKGVGPLLFFALAFIVTIIAIIVAFLLLKFRITTFMYETQIWTRYQNLPLTFFQTKMDKDKCDGISTVFAIGKSHYNLETCKAEKIEEQWKDIINDKIFYDPENDMTSPCYTFTVDNVEWKFGGNKDAGCLYNLPNINVSYPFPLPYKPGSLLNSMSLGVYPRQYTGFRFVIGG